MKDRVVFSTGQGRLCPVCGWPAVDCRCSASLTKAEPVPQKIRVKLLLEHRASGKNVTILEGLPDNASFVGELARELKKRCGTGGTAGPGRVELQGDQRERLREVLAEKGWKVKG